ncbi:MAG: hypothetical protein IJS84_08160 [Spirochaetales bacterium]|nr:hypothetical protein [Spirochaetales bacterium]
MIPYNLKHRPIVGVDNYNLIDGSYIPEETDAWSIDVGMAQWDPRDISAKVWRYGDGKWSRQSEELPLHRVLDLAILIAETVDQAPSAKVSGTFKGEFPKMQGCAKELPLEMGMESNDGPRVKSSLVRQFAEALEKENTDYLAERFAVLAFKLKKLGY